MEEDFRKDCAGKPKCDVRVDHLDLNPGCVHEIERRAHLSIFRILSDEIRIRDNKPVIDIDAMGLPAEFGDTEQPGLIVVAECSNQEVTLYGTDKVISKSAAALVLVVLDIISMLVLVVFVNLLVIL